jgi:hypothetical protein
MPQRTIAAGGGNFSSTATWVEGAIPTTSDFVVGNASSGQLTLDGNYTVQTIDMSAYTNTFTLNSTRTITLSSATTISFGASTTFAGTGTITLNAGSQTISSATTSRIPNLSIPGGTKTLTNNLYITNFNFGSPGSAFLTGSGFDVFVGGNLTVAFGCTLNTGVDLILDGTGTMNVATLSCGLNARFIINTSGTITWTNLYFLDGNNFDYISGTFVNNPFIRWDTQGTAQLLLNTSGITYDYIVVTDLGNGNTQTVSLGQNLNVANLIITRDRGTSSELLTFTSTGRLNVTDKMILQCNTATLAGTLRLNTTGSHYIDKLFALSGSLAKYVFRSGTNGTKATLQLGDKNNSPIFYVDFTDINASSGQEIRTYNGTVSNCDNVVSYSSTIFASGGGGETSSVFIS